MGSKGVIRFMLINTKAMGKMRSMRSERSVRRNGARRLSIIICKVLQSEKYVIDHIDIQLIGLPTHQYYNLTKYQMTELRLVLWLQKITIRIVAL